MNKVTITRERNFHMISDNTLWSDQLQFKKHVVKPGQYNFEVGEFVKSDTILGLHIETGRPVKAEINGRIVTMVPSPINGSVTMIIVTGDE